MQERHATWCAGLVSRFDIEACGPHQPEWLRLLRLEQANLRTAIDYCTGAADGAAAGLVMATRLDLYWSACGLLDEARHWLERALATGAGTPQERAVAMAVAARFAVLQHDRIRARELVDEGTEVATAVEDTRAVGLLLVPAAMLSAWEGIPAVAAEQADSAVGLLRAASSLPGELLALFVAGVCHAFAGNSVEATARHRQCIGRADEVGERHMKALAIAGLGENELAAGRLSEATALFRETIVLKRELGDRMGVAVGLDSLGRVAIAEGRGERAAQLLGAAEGIWDAVGMSESRQPLRLRSVALRRPPAGARTAGHAAVPGTVPPRIPAQSRRRGRVRPGGRRDADQPPPSPAEPSPLTRRELEVADLVADGLSNPEIAARLFISVRTAQGHVENILRKLGFNSRSLIAAWVTERRMAAKEFAGDDRPVCRFAQCCRRPACSAPGDARWTVTQRGALEHSAPS